MQNTKFQCNKTRFFWEKLWKHSLWSSSPSQSFSRCAHVLFLFYRNAQALCLWEYIPWGIRSREIISKGRGRGGLWIVQVDYHVVHRHSLSRAWHNSFIRATWRIHMRDMTHSTLQVDYHAIRVHTYTRTQTVSHTRTHTHTHTHIYTHTHIQVQTHTHRHTHTHTHWVKETCTATRQETHAHNTQTHKHTNTQTHKHTNTQTLKHSNSQTLKHARAHTHTHTHTHTTHTHTHTQRVRETFTVTRQARLWEQACMSCNLRVCVRYILLLRDFPLLLLLRIPPLLFLLLLLLLSCNSFFSSCYNQ